MVFVYVGEKVFGLITIMPHDRLPKGVLANQIHKYCTDTKAKSKSERCMHPIVTVKKEKSPY